MPILGNDAVTPYGLQPQDAELQYNYVPADILPPSYRLTVPSGYYGILALAAFGYFANGGGLARTVSVNYGGGTVGFGFSIYAGATQADGLQYEYNCGTYVTSLAGTEVQVFALPRILVGPKTEFSVSALNGNNADRLTGGSLFLLELYPWSQHPEDVAETVTPQALLT